MTLCFHDFAIEGEEARLSMSLKDQQKKAGADTLEKRLQAIRSRFLDWGLVAKYQWGTQSFYRLTPETYEVLKRDRVRKYFDIPYFTRMADWTCFSRYMKWNVLSFKHWTTVRMEWPFSGPSARLFLAT